MKWCVQADIYGPCRAVAALCWPVEYWSEGSWNGFKQIFGCAGPAPHSERCVQGFARRFVHVLQGECWTPVMLSGSECTEHAAGTGVGTGQYAAADDESTLLLAFRDSLVSDQAFTQLMSIRLVLQLLK